MDSFTDRSSVKQMFGFGDIVFFLIITLLIIVKWQIYRPSPRKYQHQTRDIVQAIDI